MVSIYQSVIVAVIGALIFWWARSAKAQEIGKALLWCGTLASLLGSAGRAVTLP